MSTSSTFVIQKNVAIPPKRPGGIRSGQQTASKYDSVISSLQIGDMISMPVNQYVALFGICKKRNNGYKFTTRRTDEKGIINVWRTA